MSAEQQVEQWKRCLGMAAYGSREYWRNAAIILSQYAGTTRPDTVAKLQALAGSSDEETRTIARRAQAGYSYPRVPDDDDHDGWDS